jgi:sugar lactone lactonase YvrE
MYNHAGTLLSVFSPPVENGGVDRLDFAQDGYTAFYTSKGRKIYTFDTRNSASSVWADLSKFTGQLSAIRIIPGGALNAANGVLVADQSNVRLVTKNSSGVVSVQSFNSAATTTCSPLTLDPVLANRAWVGDVSSNVLIRFNFLTGKKEVTLSTGTSSPGGICAEGGSVPHK